MHDFKNILLAWLSATSAVFMAIGERSFMTVISAIVLPIVFFSVGKTIDVCLQIYFRQRQEGKERAPQE